jgi:hypothetical protein
MVTAHGKASHVPTCAPHVIHIVEPYGRLCHYQWICRGFNLSRGYPRLKIVNGSPNQENIVPPAFGENWIPPYRGVISLLEEADEKILYGK